MSKKKILELRLMIFNKKKNDRILHQLEVKKLYDKS